MDKDRIERGREEMLRNWVDIGDGMVRCKRCGHETFRNESGRLSNLWEHELREHRD